VSEATSLEANKYGYMLAKLLREGVRETQIKKISLSMVGTLALNSTSSCEVARPHHL
jgi:hypothetical protein